jgi:predicted ferric reductase
MAPATSAALWIAAYLAAVTAPLFVLLIGPTPPGGGFAWDFAMALGFAGLAMMGVQFFLTARFKRATAPFGIDLIYYFHRYLAVVALAALLTHYLVLRLDNPALLGPADPRAAPAHMSAGRVALALFVVLVASSLARRALRFDYDWWRITHALFATVAVGLALWHIVGSGRYLAAPWKQALWLAYGAFWIALVVEVRLARPWRLARKPYRIAALRPERGRVWTLVLEPRGHAGFAFQPGQFAWLTARASPYALREHPFSIASSAARKDALEMSIKALGDFTATVKDLRSGETVFVDGPYGAFSIDRHADAPGYVFIAGGIGAAPVLGMLRTLADRSDRRPHLFLYGNRVWERVAFREELERLATVLNLRTVHALREAPVPPGCETGFVTREVLERHLPAQRDRLEYFVCGPTPMTRSVEASLGALRVPAARVHSEIFDWV